MPQDPQTLGVEEYRARVLDAVVPQPPRLLALDEALGLVSAEDVYSEIALPSFDNSSMDGYAVRVRDVADASPDQAVQLAVIGGIGAGHTGLDHLPAGKAAKIMTGAAVPDGADAVVPYEWTDRGSALVAITHTPRLGQHIRRVGEDIEAGALVLPSGTSLGPRQISFAAAVGRAKLLVHPRPTVAVVSTGTELRTPGEPRVANSLYDSNSVLLAACVERVGAEVTYRGHVGDDPADFLALIESLAEADLIITSGGISMGDYDVVKATLGRQGVWFGPLAMQPGKPQGFGRITGGALLMALPGNPVSTFVSFHEFVQPALRRMMGIVPEVAPTRTATLATDITSPPGKRQYLRGTLIDSETVGTVGGAGSHLLGGLARATCFIVIEEALTDLKAGETVTVIELGDL